uniref:Uncharacterized protein n=1 Tax=Knipowitschia caucasica TaxID=637954 RepID=A0AAV2LJ31_KNICA
MSWRPAVSTDRPSLVIPLVGTMDWLPNPSWSANVLRASWVFLIVLTWGRIILDMRQSWAAELGLYFFHQRCMPPWLARTAVPVSTPRLLLLTPVRCASVACVQLWRGPGITRSLYAALACPHRCSSLYSASAPVDPSPLRVCGLCPAVERTGDYTLSNTV